MNFFKLINFFVKDNSIIEFINNINSINRGLKIINKKICPLACLISFNFYKNKIKNFKVYCEIYRDFKEEEILRFLPIVDDFKENIKYWDKNIESSLCFGIKIDRYKTTTQYLHVKFSKNFSHTSFNKLKIRNFFDISDKRKGISIEYTKNIKMIKYYVYFEDRDDIKKLLNLYNISSPVTDLKHIEYTEFENGESKIIAVYDYDKCNTLKQIYTNITGIEKNVVRKFLKFLNLKPLYIGKYKNNTTGIYWSLPINNFLNIKK